MTFFGLYVVEKFGRRWPLFIGALWQAAWMCIFASMGTAKNPEGNETVGIVMIVAACMFIASFASTWGPIAWVVIGETFPLRTRAKQASIATASNWFGNCKSASLSILYINLLTCPSSYRFPHPLCHRRHLIRIRLRLRSMQSRSRRHRLVLPLRVSHALS